MPPANSSNDNSNPQAGQGRPLPKKENDIFKNVVKFYEQKQYKKAVKQADLILKKFPNHGETLAMKGLVLNNMGKKDEAVALVKQGLMNDMRSHVCWHVYGLLHRSDRNYNEAIKAYKQALRIDEGNLQILRDLSMLQIQMRDLPGFEATRNTLLQLKPNGKINWLALALAKHMNGDLRGAVSVIDIYLGTLSEGAPELARGFEASELALYRNRIVAEIPDNHKEALDHLSTCERVVVDRTSLLVDRATYQYKLGQYEDAKQTILDLFRRGMTENYKLHSMYMCTILQLDDDVFDDATKLSGTRTLPCLLPLTSGQKQQLLDAYKTEIYPLNEKSNAATRIPLNLVEGERFRNSLDIFIRKGLVKGVPSLCRELSSFLLAENSNRLSIIDDPVDIKEHPTYKLIVEMTEAYILSLEANKKLLPDDENEEPPSTELWTWFLRAGLHELAGEYSDAIGLTDRCLEHTPTAVDVYELKARLQRSAGDIKAAAETLDAGRDLDRQDRYINNQTTKYLLEAGREADALNRIGMFTKHEGNPEVNLYEMQCSWYELGLAACFADKKDWGKSLKKYSAVVDHFADFHEDQFDFHSYCIRKVTLRAYSDVLKFEDNLWGDQYYFEAACGMIQIYLHLHDNPQITEEDKEPDYSKMTAAERKKAKAIARKKRAQAEKKEAQKQKSESRTDDDGGNKDNKNNSQKKAGKPSPIEVDPEGKELLKKDPLEEAKKYSSILSKHCPQREETWAFQYDIGARRKKPIVALQALLQLQRMNAVAVDGCPSFLPRLVDFSLKVPTFEMSVMVKDLVNEQYAKNLLGGKASVGDIVKETAALVRTNGKTPLPLRVAVAKASVLVKTESVPSASSIIVDGGIGSRGVTVKSCRDALEVLAGFGPEASEASKSWKAAVTARFPLLTDF
mmetsp:Transcript_30264/g.73657  ORF Transcript_30264/g.73657 Transcript_30264/m.73657 type:complete len:909 (+) Transcript_30264:303-3029(+)